MQTEGTSYSGRLKYLQLCRSALITHPLQWQEFHTHLLKISGPDMNYIETTENFGNLEDAMEYYRVHDDEAEEIAKNSYNTFARRYLTPAAVSLLQKSRFQVYTNAFRSPATGDACSGHGHRSKATSRNSTHQTSKATWSCVPRHGLLSPQIGPRILQSFLRRFFSLRHLNFQCFDGVGWQMA